MAAADASRGRLDVGRCCLGKVTQPPAAAWEGGCWSGKMGRRRTGRERKKERKEREKRRKEKTAWSLSV